MGLFDFLKAGGAKKSADEAATAAELQKLVEAMDLGITDLHVAFGGGTATLRGTAPNQKSLELARLVVGNHEGVEKVNDDGLTVAASTPAGAAASGAPAKPAPSAAATPARMYTVKSGDTLSKIAKAELGDAAKYPELFEANRPMLKDPNKIYPGQVLRVPPAQPSPM
jgi:nucleoid-associated protein YgaU